jgi:hypothetical protein
VSKKVVLNTFMIIHDIPAGCLHAQCITVPEHIGERWCQYVVNSIIDSVTEDYKSIIALLDSLVKAQRIRASCCRTDLHTVRIRVFLLNKTTSMPHAPMVHAQNLVQLVDKLDLDPQKFNGVGSASNVVLRQPTLCNMVSCKISIE